ncbi:MAG: hypothetical protein GY702_08815 [Desulfobulbaceae bacterium]|nr:hypothetical protein [Desulfobulbaceae bacterium]
MNSLKTLYFPATNIYSIRQYPIFLLFQKIQLLQPVENDPADANKQTTDTFINSGFCQVDTPCPLGEHRSRFLHLVENIQNRKDDYAEQLNFLTLAAMSKTTDSTESSEQSIINELFTPQDLKKEAAEQEHEAKLWQARLVLAMGEVLDMEEEEIAKNLASLDDDASDLFKELQGEAEWFENETIFDELSQIENKIGPSHTGNMKKRLNGWGVLLRESTVQDSTVFLSTSQDAADILIDAFEKDKDTSPVVYSGLTVPALIATSGDEALASVNSFTELNSELVQTLHSQVDALSKAEIASLSGSLNKEKFKELVQRWNAASEKMFPQEEFGRIEVKIHVFPNVNCSQLMGIDATEGPRNGVMIVVD